MEQNESTGFDAKTPIDKFDFRLAQHAGSPHSEAEMLGNIGGEPESNVSIIGAKDLEIAAHLEHPTERAADFEGMIQANWVGIDICSSGNRPNCLKI